MVAQVDIGAAIRHQILIVVCDRLEKEVVFGFCLADGDHINRNIDIQSLEGLLNLVELLFVHRLIIVNDETFGFIVDLCKVDYGVFDGACQFLQFVFLEELKGIESTCVVERERGANVLCFGFKVAEGSHANYQLVLLLHGQTPRHSLQFSIDGNSHILQSVGEVGIGHALAVDMGIIEFDGLQHLVGFDDLGIDLIALQLLLDQIVHIMGSAIRSVFSDGSEIKGDILAVSFKVRGVSRQIIIKLICDFILVLDFILQRKRKYVVVSLYGGVTPIQH